MVFSINAVHHSKVSDTMKNLVPVLITCDIDPTPEVCLENKKQAIQLTMDLFKKFEKY